MHPKLFDLSELTARVRAVAHLIEPEEAKAIAECLEVLERHNARHRFFSFFPDEGPLARRHYPRHLEFFTAGLLYRLRLFMAANRVGKTISGAFETTAHCTGDYPDWWPGRRFPGAVDAWAVGKTNETTRDIIQKELLGKVVSGTRKGVDGTGMIPGDLLGVPTWKQGVADLVDTIPIRNVQTGHWSYLGFKAYQQGRGSFEGTAKHWVWCDEEPPADVFDEICIRTATVGGLVGVTFTPLEGMSEVVQSFLESELRPS